MGRSRNKITAPQQAQDATRAALHSRSHAPAWECIPNPKTTQGSKNNGQKLDYIHQNPVKRGYVDEVIHWRYSNAMGYAGMAGLL